MTAMDVLHPPTFSAASEQATQEAAAKALIVAPDSPWPEVREALHQGYRLLFGAAPASNEDLLAAYPLVMPPRAPERMTPDTHLTDFERHVIGLVGIDQRYVEKARREGGVAALSEGVQQRLRVLNEIAFSGSEIELDLDDMSATPSWSPLHIAGLWDDPEASPVVRRVYNRTLALCRGALPSYSRLEDLAVDAVGFDFADYFGEVAARLQSREVAVTYENVVAAIVAELVSGNVDEESEFFSEMFMEHMASQEHEEQGGSYVASDEFVERAARSFVQEFELPLRAIIGDVPARGFRLPPTDTQIQRLNRLLERANPTKGAERNVVEQARRLVALFQSLPLEQRTASSGALTDGPFPSVLIQDAPGLSPDLEQIGNDLMQRYMEADPGDHHALDPELFAGLPHIADDAELAESSPVAHLRLVVTVEDILASL